MLILIYELLDKSKLIKSVRNQLDGYVLGDRSLYSQIFRPLISPNFMLTRLMAKIPVGAEEIDTYAIDNQTHVSIFKTNRQLPLFLSVSDLIEFKILFSF